MTMSPMWVLVAPRWKLYPAARLEFMPEMSILSGPEAKSVMRSGAVDLESAAALKTKVF